MASPTDGHEFEQAPGDSEGQGSLACCSPWGCKESDMTDRLNNTRSLAEFLPRLVIYSPIDSSPSNRCEGISH